MTFSENNTNNFLKGWKNVAAYMPEQLKELDPEYLVKKFFDPNENLFIDIEMIMQGIIAVCCVKQSCKSVLESLVLQYKNHFNSNRNMGENNVNEKFFISPNLADSNNVIKRAMNK